MTTTHPGPPAPAVLPAPGPVVSARGLTVAHGTFRAVDSVDLDIRPGEVFALLGTNGAGKTTTLEVLLGLRRRTGGTLSVLGEDPGRGTALLRRSCGTMLQDPGFLPESTPRSTVALWAALSSRVDDVDAALERVGLAHRADVAVQRLSGGERRRLDLALALWGAPELVVLDEPTTGLDPESRRTLWDLVRGLHEAGTTVVLTTHHLEEAEALADRVAIMHEGRVAVAGTLPEVLAARPASIRADVPPDAPVAALLDGLPGATATAVRRAAGARTALHVTSRDLPEDLLRLLTAARAAGVRLEDLRATPASLEEVFHAVRAGGPSTRPAEHPEESW
ncbi:ABC transporter ATP-binding protein [Kineococcus sp. NUM-3379]